MKKERFEILFEEMRGDIKLILEGYSVLNNKIDNLDGRLSGWIKEVENKLDFSVKTIRKDIENLSQKLDTHIKQPQHSM